MTRHQRSGFTYRFAYARATETRLARDPGQDYLVVRDDGERLAFALCDGVSQSFMGDVAARIVGDALVDWLWDRCSPSASAAANVADCRSLLDSLRPEAQAAVDSVVLPAGLPDMVREVLEQKRGIGSESTFVAGLVGAPSERTIFVWMGDSRLRLWNAEREITGQLGGVFDTGQHWSTRRGAIGEPNVGLVPPGELRRFVAYSDGLALLDDRIERPIDDDALGRKIGEISREPSSDDVSYMEYWRHT